MNGKILIPLLNDNVAPRFDLATDVLILRSDAAGTAPERKLLILPQASAERLCQLVLAEGVATVVCGGIEAEHFDYLIWKHVRVIDNVIGSAKAVLARLERGRLDSGDVLDLDECATG
jgi:predicted Fe-Mo cluster-binding NifX family protein